MRLLAWITRYTSIPPEYVEQMTPDELDAFCFKLGDLLKAERVTDEG